MTSRIASVLAFLLALWALSAAAQGSRPYNRAKPPAAPARPAPAVKPGSAAEEFYRLNDERKMILAKLADLKLRYQTANDEQRASIDEQWKEQVAKGDKIGPRLLAVAQKAYSDAPNADPAISDFLLTVLIGDVRRDDYEPAARIGKLLMDNRCSENRLPLLAAVAALMVSDYDAAQQYLTLAIAQIEPSQIGPNLLSKLTELFQRDPREKEAAEQRAKSVATMMLMFLDKPDVFKKDWAKEKMLREDEAKTDNLPRVLLKTTKGDIELELFEKEAPNTVANFISLVERGFYNDTPFHRVLPGFMAQGGDPKGTGNGGPGYSIACECYKPNARLHFRGTLSMAHAGRDTGGSQFFLTFVPTLHLNGRHTAFGRVIGGMDVLAKLQRRDPEKDTDVRPDKILEAKVLRKRPHEYKPEKMPE